MLQQQVINTIACYKKAASVTGWNFKLILEYTEYKLFQWRLSSKNPAYPMPNQCLYNSLRSYVFFSLSFIDDGRKHPMWVI